MATRKENERAYPNWDELADGGRRYWRERLGGDFGKCRYVKIVDQKENTISFVQEIYDDAGNLIEIHQKYPADTGHRYLAEDDAE
jgi:hypothetical protein